MYREKKVKFMLYNASRIYTEQCLIKSIMQKRKRVCLPFRIPYLNKAFLCNFNVFLLFFSKALGMGTCKLYINPFVLYINEKIGRGSLLTSVKKVKGDSLR